jgi:hypothetical protein
MPHLTAEYPMSSPQGVVAPRLLTVLSGYAQRDDFTLTVDVGLAHAAMSAPVRIQLGDGRSATAIPFTLGAREHTDWFPAFRGELRSDDEGPLSSRLLLIGDYEIPLGTIGTIVNRSLLGNAAERSLRAFGERFRADVLDEIRRSELDIRRHEQHT